VLGVKPKAKLGAKNTKSATSGPGGHMSEMVKARRYNLVCRKPPKGTIKSRGQEGTDKNWGLS